MNILLVNTNDSFIKAVKQSLGKVKSRILVSKNILTVLDDIQKHKINTVIINWTKNDIDIADLCKKIKKLKQNRYIYILVVTLRNKQDKLLPLANLYIDDFIFKPFGKEELQTRLKIAVGKIRTAQSLSRANKKIIKLVKEDPVTSLLNRRALMDEVLKEMGRASRNMDFIAAIMTSVTNIEKIIELHGIDMGDLVLAELARRLKSTCRPYDEIGRFDASHFLLFLPDAGKDAAEKVASRIIKAAARKPLYIKGKKIVLTVAVGISELNPKTISSNKRIDSNLVNDLVLDAIIKKSELAMRKAEKKGPNEFIVLAD